MRIRSLLLLGVLLVAGCAERTLPTATATADMTTPATDLAPTTAARDLASPIDLTAPPPDIDFQIDHECSEIVMCVMQCSSSDMACIAQCKSNHTTAALMDAQSMLACAIPACGSTFPGNGGDEITAGSCIGAHCTANEATCGIPLPP